VKYVLMLALLACAGAPPRPTAHELPSDARLVDRDSGSFVAAERYRGKVVVLDFWAAWCKECRQTIPQVARLAAAFAQDGLVVVGVNEGEAPADATTSARDLGIPYAIALDPELVFADRMGAQSLPMLVVIDRSGAVVHRARSVDRETLAVIRKLLKN
jgi:thiol-disulfide isomerase/thioredoxin